MEIIAVGKKTLEISFRLVGVCGAALLLCFMVYWMFGYCFVEAFTFREFHA